MLFRSTAISVIRDRRDAIMWRVDQRADVTAKIQAIMSIVAVGIVDLRILSEALRNGWCVGEGRKDHVYVRD